MARNKKRIIDIGRLDARIEADMYLNEHEVSLWTGIPVSSLQKHRHYSKGLPYRKLDTGHVVYKPSEVKQYLENCKVVPALEAVS